MLPAPTQGRSVEGHNILAYLTDEDCAALPGGEPQAVLARVVPMAADGHLVCRSGAAPMTGARPMRPAVFLGRSADGRLAYLCQPVPLGSA